MHLRDPKWKVCMQVYLHMLASPMIPDRTACMILIMAAGRRGAWQVAEQVTLTTLLPSFPLSPLVAAGPPPGTMKAGERQLIHALCRASGASMTHDPTLGRGAHTPLQAAAAAAASAIAASEAAGPPPAPPPPPPPAPPPQQDESGTSGAVGGITLVTSHSDASLPGSAVTPTRPHTNSSIASGGAPGAAEPELRDGDTAPAGAARSTGDGKEVDAPHSTALQFNRERSEKAPFPERGRRGDSEAIAPEGRRRIASTGTDMPAHPVQAAYALDQSVPSSMASSLLTTVVVDGAHSCGIGAGGEGPDGLRRQWARTLSEPHVSSARALPHALLPTLSSPGAAAAYADAADALAQRMDTVLGAGDAAAAGPESVAGRSASADTDRVSTAADAAALWPESDGGGEDSPGPPPSDMHASTAASSDSPKRSSKLLLNLLKRCVGARQQAGHGGSAAAWLQGNSPVHAASARGVVAAVAGGVSPGRPQTGPAPVRPGLLAGDPLARACCNALLLAYAHAEQPLIGRAVALLESMIQCVLFCPGPGPTSPPCTHVSFSAYSSRLYGLRPGGSLHSATELMNHCVRWRM